MVLFFNERRRSFPNEMFYRDPFRSASSRRAPERRHWAHPKGAFLFILCKTGGRGGLAWVGRCTHASTPAVAQPWVGLPAWSHPTMAVNNETGLSHASRPAARRREAGW